MELLIVLLIILLVGAFVVYMIIRAVKGALQNALGSAANTLIKEAFKEEANAPKSISNMTAMYKPKIERDFPETGYYALEQMASNGIAAILESIEGESILGLLNPSDNLVNHVANVIDDNKKSKGIHVFYNDIKVHKIGISKYSNTGETATAIFEIALEYIYYAINRNTLSEGSKTTLLQTVYEVVLSYNKLKGENGEDISSKSNCSNCGAPILGADNGNCNYCGSLLFKKADREWQIESYRKL